MKNFTTSAKQEAATLRQQSANLIESKVRQLAEEACMSASSCSWNLDQGWKNGGPHRLDVCVKCVSVKIYFTDVELMEYLEGANAMKIDARLRCLMNELGEEDAAYPIASALNG